MAGMNFSIDIEDYTSSNKKFDRESATQILAEQIVKDTEPYVPMLSGKLTEGTTIEDGTIVYPGPYARYLYYGKVMVDSETGKGPYHWYDKAGNEYFRFRKGAKLVPTSRDLTINRTFHTKAQAYWFEASKAQNMEKWRKAAADAVSQTKEGIISRIIRGFRKR